MTNKSANLKSGSNQFNSVSQQLHYLEDKYNLYQYQIDGWCAWAILRPLIADVIIDLPWSEKRASAKLSLLQRLTLAIKDIPKLINPPKVGYIVEKHTGALREQVGNLYKDIFVDELLLAMDKKDHFKIEELHVSTFLHRRQKALIKSDVTSTMFLLPPRLLAKFSGPQYISTIAKQMSALLQQETNLSTFTFKRIRLELRAFYWTKKFYGWLFDRTQPHYLIRPMHSGYAMVAAAKERGIKTIELQHGSPNCDKIPYSWAESAITYKSKLPIPDKIFLYGEHFAQQLKTNNFWHEELYLAGSLVIDQYRHKREAYQSTNKSNSITLLITTQGIDVEKLISFFVQFLKIVPNHVNVDLYFKLHPKFETKKTPYETAFATNNTPNKQVYIILGNESPATLELMIKADFHLTIYSTTHYEALSLGIPTIILPFTNHQMMLPLYEKGHSLFVKTPEDLLNIILSQPHPQVATEISTFYFQPNALENMKTALNL